MKVGWKQVRLGELVDNKIVELKRGRIIPKTALSESYDYPVYSASTQGNALLGYSDTYDFDEELISWSVDGGGKPFYRNKHKFSVTNVCGYLRILRPDILNYKFLYYCMRNEWSKNKFDYSHKAHPSVIRELYNILIPPMDEQLKIASILSELDNLSDVHSSKAQVLTRIKSQLMSNKSGIIERERASSEEIQSLNSKIIDITSRLPQSISSRIGNEQSGVNKIIDIFTYVGEDNIYERERERERAELLPEITWKTAKLGELCKLIKGKNPKTLSEKNEGRPIVSAPEIQIINGQADYGKWTTEELPSCSEDDILLLWDGHRAGLAGFNHNAILSSTIMKLEIKDKNQIHPHLLYYIVKQNADTIRGGRSGSAVPHINRQVVENLEIRYPESLEHQKLVAKILLDLDELANLHKHKQDILSRMKQQLMSNKTGIIESERQKSEISASSEVNRDWVEIKLGELCDTRNGYTPSKSIPEYWEDGTIPWYRMEDIRKSGHVLYDSIQHIHPNGLKKSGTFPVDSIILATTATIGEHALLKTPAISNQQFTCFVVKDKYKQLVDINYLYWYFYIIDDWCKQNANTGTSFPTVDVQRLKQQKIWIPKSISEQKRISSLLQSYDSLIDSQQQLLKIVERERAVTNLLTHQLLTELALGKESN